MISSGCEFQRNRKCRFTVKLVPSAEKPSVRVNDTLKNLSVRKSCLKTVYALQGDEKINMIIFNNENYVDSEKHKRTNRFVGFDPKKGRVTNNFSASNPSTVNFGQTSH